MNSLNFISVYLLLLFSIGQFLLSECNQRRLIGHEDDFLFEDDLYNDDVDDSLLDDALLYEDEPFNDTHVEHQSSVEKKVEAEDVEITDFSLEWEILNLMGFPETPKDPQKAPIRKRSAPNFMYDIYMNSQKDEDDNAEDDDDYLLPEEEEEEQVVEAETVESLPQPVFSKPSSHQQQQQQQQQQPDQFKISVKNRRIIKESDVIVSFQAEQPHQGRGGKPDQVRRMWFDVNDIPDEDELIHAELRLFRITNGLRKKNRGAIEIEVNRVIRTDNGVKEFLYVDSVKTEANYEGWLTLNVTTLLDFWIKGTKHDNRGIKIFVYPLRANGERGQPKKAENMGIIGFDGDDEKQPFITGFFKNHNSNKIQLKWQHLLKNRPKRSTRSEPGTLDSIIQRQSPDKLLEKTYTHPCVRKKLHVNFKAIRWHEWIIAPGGYDAYFCGGQCEFPITVQGGATNHAIVQAMMRLRYPDLPSPCCVPKKLSSISVLYFQGQNNVVLKKYNDMVVDECGCR